MLYTVSCKGWCYDVLVGLILLSHVAFFFVMRTEFLRLKDVSHNKKYIFTYLIFLWNSSSVVVAEDYKHKRLL